MRSPCSRRPRIDSSAAGTLSCQGSRAGPLVVEDAVLADCAAAGGTPPTRFAPSRPRYVNTEVIAAANVVMATTALQECVITTRILCSLESGFGAAAASPLL